MSGTYADKDVIIQKVTEALTSFHAFEIGDRAIVTNVAYSNLRRFDVVTVTHKHTDTALVVEARGVDGTERRGTIHPSQVLPAEPLGQDIDGNEVHMHDYVEGVDEHKGDLLLVVGVNEDGEGITHAVKIRLEPTVETHVNTIVSLENTVLSTVEEWRQPRAGDVVEFMEHHPGDYYGYATAKGEVGVLRPSERDGMVSVVFGFDELDYDEEAPIKTIYRM